MVIVERHAQTEVQVIEEADSHKEVARKSRRIIKEGVISTIHLINTTTGKGPGIGSNGTAGTYHHVPLAEGLCVNLAQAFGTAGHNAGMGEGQTRNSQGGGQYFLEEVHVHSPC